MTRCGEAGCRGEGGVKARVRGGGAGDGHGLGVEHDVQGAGHLVLQPEDVPPHEVWGTTGFGGQETPT